MGWGQQSQAAAVSCRSEEPLLLPLQMVDDALRFSAPSPANYHPLPRVLHPPQVNWSIQCQIVALLKDDGAVWCTMFIDLLDG
jgi:hypothetical protein